MPTCCTWPEGATGASDGMVACGGGGPSGGACDNSMSALSSRYPDAWRRPGPAALGARGEGVFCGTLNPSHTATSATLQNAARRLVPLRLSRPRCWRRAVLRLRARHARCASRHAHIPLHPGTPPIFTASESESPLRTVVGVLPKVAPKIPLNSFSARYLPCRPRPPSGAAEPPTARPTTPTPHFPGHMQAGALGSLLVGLCRRGK